MLPTAYLTAKTALRFVFTNITFILMYTYLERLKWLYIWEISIQTCQCNSYVFIIQ